MIIFLLYVHGSSCKVFTSANKFLQKTMFDQPILHLLPYATIVALTLIYPSILAYVLPSNTVWLLINGNMTYELREFKWILPFLF